jgi:UDP-N-acetylmuramoylalanine--D-glutamate ligase
MVKQRAVIAGLGLTGQSVVRYLRSQGWQVAATDTRAAPAGIDALRAAHPDMPITLGALDEKLLRDADCVVASPGLPLGDRFFESARAQGLPIIGDIELFAHSNAKPVVGITGTNGKSTVTTLVAQMARTAGIDARAGGNLAPPALDLLQGKPAGLYVLELSSYQLETTKSLRMVAATVLNVTPDHLDRYASVQDYADAKARIFAQAQLAVLNRDDPIVMAMLPRGTSAVTFSLYPDRAADYALAHHDDADWIFCRGVALMPVKEMRIVGRHNVANALAALALGDALGLPRDAMRQALREYTGLAHRTAWVADIRGVRYVNDSKGTNVGATVAAVAGFDGPMLLILGGDGKNQDFTPLRSAFVGKVRHALLIGRDAQAISTALQGVCPLTHCESLEAAVVAAAGLAKAGDTVLLSPACASLDMFRDYAHRGQVFVNSVQRLAA